MSNPAQSYVLASFTSSYLQGVKYISRLVIVQNLMKDFLPLPYLKKICITRLVLDR